MTKFVVDAFAWVEYLAATSVGNRVRALVEDEANEIYTSAFTVAEMVSQAERRGQNGRKVADLLERASVVVPMDLTLAVGTGLIHADRKRRIKDYPYGDAAVLACAKRLRARVLTGDPHFRDESNVEYLS